MKVFNYVVECNFRSRHKFSHFRLHKHTYYSHLVWGKLSLTYGQPHLVPIRVCAECLEQIESKSAGDESWDYCEGCHQVEGNTIEITTEEYEAAHG